ncbi:MAG: hypothetical protein ACI898_001134, partial [Flavobacteriales bacterium]
MWVIACISVFSILASGCSNERRLANGKPLK